MKQDPYDKEYRMLHLKKLSDYQWYWIFGGMTVLIPLTLMLYLHNRYLPVQEGWFNYYAFLMNKKGLLPYKDFYLFLQPLWLFFVQWIAKINDSFIYLRYWGILERSLLIIAVYYLMAREFSPIASFLGVVAATSVFQSINVDLLYTFYQTTMLFFVLALILLLESYRSESMLYFVGIGFLTALAFFTKQSSGLFILVFFLFVLFWDVPIRRFFSRLIHFTLGMTLPTIAILAWLLQNDILLNYAQQVFGGSSSKGSVFAMLFGFWNHNNAVLIMTFYLICAILLVVMIRLGIFKVWVQKNKDHGQHTNMIVILEIASALFLALLVIPNTALAHSLADSASIYTTAATYLAFFMLILGVAFVGYRWLLKQNLPVSKPIAVISLGALVWMYSSGISYQIDEASVLLGMSVVTAYFFDYVKFNTQLPRLITLAMIIALVFFTSVRKLYIPYSWWGWTEFHHEQGVTSAIPVLKGFHLNPEGAKIYDGIYRDIMENTLPTDSIYTYPHIVFFNFVTGRLQSTFSPVHYFDVTPDSLAVEDARLLREKPPKMIIFLSMPESVYLFHENAFRNGQKSGQRQIEAAINEIVEKHHYHMIDEFITPGFHWKLRVYVKPEE
jgi:hypothetical protein